MDWFRGVSTDVTRGPDHRRRHRRAAVDATDAKHWFRGVSIDVIMRPDHRRRNRRRRRRSRRRQSGTVSK